MKKICHMTTGLTNAKFFAISPGFAKFTKQLGIWQFISRFKAYLKVVLWINETQIKIKPKSTFQETKIIFVYQLHTCIISNK